MNEMGDLLQRFHRVLVEEIRAKRPEYLSGPFTVAEIYQNLVPYGTHRDRLGVEMNGDYEDALLRLLAGEGGYLSLESEHALTQLREELETSNPNTGLYRDFAAVDVRLSHRRAAPVAHAATSAGGSGSGGAPAAPPPQAAVRGDGAEEAVSISDLAPSAGETAPPEMTGAETSWVEALPAAQDQAPAGHTHEAYAAPDHHHHPDGGGSPASGSDNCPWCRADLPPRSNLNFCPFCGTDVHVVPCPGCGEELEPDWRFCISCGTEVAG